jgi:2-iminobutanoate/2-iminopropanoate deaminase
MVELGGTSAPAIIGHYCHAATMPNGMVQLSGQKAWIPETGILIDGGIEEQTTLVIRNIRAILNGLGLELDSLTRLVCHLHRVEDYESFNRAYAAALGQARPARTVLAGAELRGGALVEIVADAFNRKYMA